MNYKIFINTLVVAGLFMPNQVHAQSDNSYRYMITESAIASSLDPLDADSTNNLPVARMIYATPLEISHENQLSSSILEKFSYDVNTHTMHWTVKPSLKFDDESPITADDVAFAVARMAYTRPNFPVIENIAGIQDWAKSTHALNALPSGVKLNGNSITIQFNKNIPHPLFRFCLELFSIIPKKCVDLHTNKITCKEIPASGYYRIQKRENNSISFIKRNGGKINDVASPNEIRFEYLPAEHLLANLDKIDDKTVVTGNEVLFSTQALDTIQKTLATKFAPASRFSGILLNPHSEPFQNQKCRQLFGKAFRESYATLLKQPAEASIFTKILPGYLSVEALEKADPVSEKDVQECKSLFQHSSITWGYAESEKRAIFLDTLNSAFHKIGLEIPAPIVTQTRDELVELFIAGKVSILGAGSGFWALDPVGDVKMLFTPNLHKALKFMNGDHKLQKIIASLEGDQGAYTELNQYLYHEATFNVYSHQRRFFASSNKNLLMDVPFAITSPAPWQVFRLDQ